MKARLPKEYQNKGAGNMNSLALQAQKMQDEINAAQERVNALDFEETAGGGAIKLVMNGERVLKSVKFDPEVIDRDNPEDLEDLIVSGVNAIIKKIDDVSAVEMEKIGARYSVPGLF
ncbi:MAG: YbaB/EbfC family nucleoid-associated protein [Oscillospiraceae bacterium]|jgi:DNA-binding YbaB/EbfC family protein|nr:YbaB/EbfC family nucleoid-associated protein [Oscillospiraceae bacterium]